MLDKDETEHQLPKARRSKFRQVAIAFVAQDYQLRDHPIEGIAPISAETARSFANSVAAYGDALTPLNDAVWERSVYRWMGGHWQMLVDLSTEGETVSDLTLHAKLHESNGKLELSSVHVP